MVSGGIRDVDWVQGDYSLYFALWAAIFKDLKCSSERRSIDFSDEHLLKEIWIVLLSNKKFDDNLAAESSLLSSAFISLCTLLVSNNDLLFMTSLLCSSLAVVVSLGRATEPIHCSCDEMPSSLDIYASS